MLTRKQFLKTFAAAGFGALLCPVPAAARRWRDGGARLVHARRQSLVMGSVAAFDVVAPGKADAYAAIRRGVRAFRRVDALLSMYRTDSEAALLEHRAGRAPVPLSPETARVLRFAGQMAEHTGGRFDVTIEPLMRRWGFRRDPRQPVTPPTDEEVRRLERLVGYRKLHVEGRHARLAREGMAVDLGGVAGGYALDCAVEVMKGQNVAAAFINFSGDVACFGQRAEGHPWTVRLLDPATQQPRARKITLRDEALSTSGSYENRRHSQATGSWGHLLAPGQGEPVAPCGSVTALHPSAMVADAWSTACYVGAAPGDPQLRLITL